MRIAARSSETAVPIKSPIIGTNQFYLAGNEMNQRIIPAGVDMRGP
jgi:hypothetical protein